MKKENEESWADNLLAVVKEEVTKLTTEDVTKKKKSSWMDSLSGYVIILLILVVFTSPFLIFMNPLWVDSDGAERILTATGMADVKIEGYSWFWLNCSKYDLYRTKFTAKNIHGVTVTGTVCRSFFNSSSIHFD